MRTALVALLLLLVGCQGSDHVVELQWSRPLGEVWPDLVAPQALLWSGPGDRTGFLLQGPGSMRLVVQPIGDASLTAAPVFVAEAPRMQVHAFSSTRLVLERGDAFGSIDLQVVELDDVAQPVAWVVPRPACGSYRPLGAAGRWYAGWCNAGPVGTPAFALHDREDPSNVRWLDTTGIEPAVAVEAAGELLVFAAGGSVARLHLPDDGSPPTVEASSLELPGVPFAAFADAGGVVVATGEQAQEPPHGIRVRVARLPLAPPGQAWRPSKSLELPQLQAAEPHFAWDGEGQGVVSGRAVNNCLGWFLDSGCEFFTAPAGYQVREQASGFEVRTVLLPSLRSTSTSPSLAVRGGNLLALEGPSWRLAQYRLRWVGDPTGPGRTFPCFSDLTIEGAAELEALARVRCGHAAGLAISGRDVSRVDLPWLRGARALSLHDLPAAATVNLPLLRSGQLRVEGLPALTDVSFPALETGIVIVMRTGAQRVALPVLVESEWIELNDNPLLAAVDVPRLVVGNLSLLDLMALVDLTLPALRSGGVQASLTALRRLALPGLGLGRSVLALTGNPYLVEVEAPALRAADLIITYDERLSRLALPVLESGSLMVEGCQALAEVLLPAATSLDRLEVSSNLALTTLDLPALRHAPGLFRVVDNPRLPECAVLAMRDRLVPPPPMEVNISGNDAAATCLP